MPPFFYCQFRYTDEMTLRLTLSLSLMLFFGAVVPASALELVKSDQSSAVYYVDGHGVRHAFPTSATYRSWYGDQFTNITTISANLLAKYPLGQNITMRPGVFLVKIQTAPSVYAIEPGGVLRELQNESIAESIYGRDWAKRVVDVPDVFFNDYTLGEQIRHDYTTPDGIVYQDKETKKYYYKKNDILRPFASVEALFKNGFNPAQALTGAKSFFIREKPITDRDTFTFNPVEDSLVDRRDCSAKQLKIAYIFVVDKNYTPEEVSNIEKVKAQLSDRYAWATNNLSSLDATHPTFIAFNDGYVLEKRTDGTTEVRNELINTFYDVTPDEFDFIFVWTNFKTPAEDTNEIAHFTAVTNRQEGIGRGLLDRSSIFGSAGKLKGVIMMGNIHKYTVDQESGLSRALNISMHEILHQWAAYISFVDVNGKMSKALLRPDDNQHWSYYAAVLSPLGGSGWVQNKPGIFTSELALLPDSDKRPFSDLELYLMGLIPKRFVQPVMYVVPTNPGVLGNEIGGTARYVTVDQIIAANGEVKCSKD